MATSLMRTWPDLELRQPSRAASLRSVCLESCISIHEDMPDLSLQP